MTAHEPRASRNTLTWLGQAGFVLELDGLRVLIDPFTSDHETRLVSAPDEESLATGVDWLLVTHEHLDHFVVGFVRALDRHSPGAGLVVPSPLVEEAERIAPRLGVVGVRPGDRTRLSDRVGVHVMPAWHGIEPADGYTQGFDETGGSRFVGFVVGTADVSIYHSGDSIVTDELRAALAGEQIDVALLPINGRDYYRESLGLVGNMDGREALHLARELGVQLLVPMHWDLFAGNTVRPGALVDEASIEADIHVLVPARHVPAPSRACSGRVTGLAVGTVLVTGGAGFLGSHVTAGLLNAGETVVVYDTSIATNVLEHVLSPDARRELTLVQGEIVDGWALLRLCERESVDRVLHLAAPLTDSVQQNPLAGLRAMCGGTATLLEVRARSRSSGWSGRARSPSTAGAMTFAPEVPLRGCPSRCTGASRCSARILPSLIATNTGSIASDFASRFSTARGEPAGSRRRSARTAMCFAKPHLGSRW